MKTVIITKDLNENKIEDNRINYEMWFFFKLKRSN